jgi:hypothetical protein
VARTETLDKLADIARDAGLSGIADASRATAERLRAGLFYVACVGQFKRGKSTLLNALVRMPLLPTGVVPVTSVVTIIRYGERLTARTRFKGGDWTDCDPATIGRYVTEESNPGNRQGVVSVEVTIPSKLLAQGLCLVDTPGLGSVVLANSAATRAFVPHVDAAILVLGCDPPITAVSSARERETAALAASLRSNLDEQRVTLLRPIQESEKRLAALRVTVADAERSLSDLAHLLNAEQERLVRRFSDERERFFDRALAGAAHELQLALSTGPKNAWRLRAYAVEEAQAITRRCLERWRRDLESSATALYREAEDRFVELVNSFRARLTERADLAGLPAVHPASGFRAKSGFYYTEIMSIAAGSAMDWALDRAFPRSRRSAIQRKVWQYLERLLEVNSARIKNDFDDRLTESRRHLEHEMRGALHGLIMAADTAVTEARRAHTAGAAVVKSRLDEIDRLQERLRMLERCDQGAADGRLPP